MAELPQRGVLRVVPPAQLDRQLQAEDDARAQAEDAAANGGATEATGLAGYIRGQFDIMKRHRDGGSGWTSRLLAAMRVFNGRYDTQQLNEIRKFGGSDVYARVVAMKCRGASSLLRDVYLAPQRPWGLDPPADPDVPPEVMQSVEQLVTAEVGMMQQATGQPPDATMMRDRTLQLMEGARQAAKKRAGLQARVSEQRIEEYLEEGGFYNALAEFITDLPLFPFACIKGPVVRIVPTVAWVNGKADVQQKPKLFWNRISPFDIWWTPGVNGIEDAEIIERTRITRADLNDLLDLPGYNQEAVRSVLDEYGRGGINDDWDASDAERAVEERRENPQFNQSGMLAMLEYHGNVQGRLLLELGMDKSKIPDELRDYFVQAWLIGRYVIKVQLSPSPRKRHPYYITSFEKVPGTPVGNGLPDILSDIQDVANATLRSLVNNLAISSGPQVVVHDELLAPNEDGEDMFPWKRWHVLRDPMGNSSGSLKPIDFFQPNSNAQELLGVYQKFLDMADELSAIPKYLAGSSQVGGAGRTASGLAMLMGNASKILQTVAANIDRDVLDPLLNSLFDMIMLTDTTGMLTGQESIKVLGVNVAVQKETQRSRQLEFLQQTANPIDVQIMGPKGRASVLRAVASTIGLDGEEIVPSDDEIEKKQKEQEAMMAAQQAAGQQEPPDKAAGPPGQREGLVKAGAQAQGGQQGAAATGDMGPRVNLQEQQRQAAGPNMGRPTGPRIGGGVH